MRKIFQMAGGVSAFIGAGLFGVSLLWGSHTFEGAEGYEAGFVSGQNGWSGSGSVEEAADAPQGARVLIAQAGGATLELGAGAEILYADLWLKPLRVAAGEIVPLLQLGGVQVGLGDNARFYAKDGGEWVESGAAPTLTDGAFDWARLTLFMDTAQTPPVWDFYIDGVLAQSGIAPDTEIPALGLTIFNAQADDVCVGDFEELLLLEDLTDDGGLFSLRNRALSAWASMAGSEMQAKASSPSESSETSLAETPAPLRGGGVADTYYVNPVVGSDSYDGLSATVSGNSGPKATLPAAIAAATTGDTILLSASTHTVSATLSAPSKTLTIAALSGTATLSGN